VICRFFVVSLEVCGSSLYYSHAG